jgi:hypothetical protein
MPFMSGETRVRMEDLGDRVRVSIPLPRSWIQVFLVIFWFAGWVWAGFPLLNSLFGVSNDSPPSPGFALSFLGSWLVITALAIRYWLPRLAGRQVIDISDSSISIREAVAGLGLPRKYAADQIANLRVANPSDPHEISGLSEKELAKAMADGPLAFDYGTRTVHFGPGLLDVEAGQILAELLGRFPRYRVPERPAG